MAKNLIRSLFSFGGVQVAQILLPLIALPYLARVLGPESFGIVLYMLSLSTLAALAVEWGFTLGAVRDVARCRDDVRARRHTVSAVLSAKCLLALFCACLAALAFPFLPHAFANATGYVWTVAYGIILGCNPTWYFQGLGTGMPRMALWDVASSAAALLLLFLFVSEPEEWPRYPLCLLLCKTTAYGAQTMLMIRSVGGARLDWHCGWAALRSMRMLFANRLASMLSMQGNTLILAGLLPSAHVGILLASDKMARAVVSIAAPVTQALFPEICAHRENNPQRTARLLRLSLTGTALSMLCAAGALWLAAPWLVPLALGERYEEAIPTLRVMAALIPVLACNIVLGTQTLVSFGQEKALTAVLLGMGLLSLPSVAGMASLFGMPGAAWMPVLTESCICLGLCACIRVYCPQALRPQEAQRETQP